MPIKNLMEDIVKTVIDEVLERENKDLAKSVSFKDDVLSYVLNRVPPRYCTSERGIMHGKLESRFSFQTKSDVLFLVHEAVKLIGSRRESVAHTKLEGASGEKRYLPHIFGKVMEETTLSIISDIEVSLLHNGNQIPMLDNSWKNPYITNKSTKGYFHFWPNFNSKTMDGKEVSLKIKFSHDKFEDHEVEIKVPIRDDIATNRSFVVPIVVLKVKKGVDVSKLYD